jgi:phospholipid-binding lipoprotein MlaA
MKPHIFLVVALGLSACTSSDPDALAQHDPFEPTNRAVFNFDVQLDHTVATPIAKVYRTVMPEPARDGIHNALDNLNAPVVFVNDVLQGDGDKATTTFGRFVINSTIGLGGLIDVAAKMGMHGHTNDFGITLGQWGAQEGSYLVLPFVGPKPPRDLTGDIIDIGFDPTTYMKWNNSTLYTVVRTGLGVLDGRAANIDAVESIERSSLDFYATTRSLYRQNRAAQINGGKAPDQDLPNF